MVRGFIAQEKGVNVNWATATTLIEKEEVYKLEVMALKSEGTKLSGTTMSWRLDTRGDSIKNHVVLVKNLEVEKGLCPFVVSLQGENIVKYT